LVETKNRFLKNGAVVGFEVLEMNKKWLLLIGVVGIAALLAFAMPGEKETMRVEWGLGAKAVEAEATGAQAVHLTVYDSGRALVKEERSVGLTAGLNYIALEGVSPLIDSSSVLFNNLESLEEDYSYALRSESELLRAHLKREVTVTTESGSVTGVLLSAGSTLVLETVDGLVSIRDYDEVAFLDSPELSFEPTLSALVNAESGGEQSFTLSYLAGGLDWSADYAVITQEGELYWKAFVTIENQAGVDYEDAELTIIAGDLNQEQNYYYDDYEYGYAMEAAAPRAAGGFSESSVSEYHAYSLERSVTLEDGASKRLSLASAEGINYEEELVFTASRSNSVEITLEFENNESPLPVGSVRVYEETGNGLLVLIGSDSIPHTAVGDAIELEIGSAFDVEAEKVQVDYELLGECTREATYEVTVSNYKEETIVVRVVEDSLWGDWTVISESLQGEKTDANTMEWLVTVPANGETILSYEVRTTSC
jgi:hypothetical protein